MAKQRYVIVRGQVFRWEEKEPFTPSGKSVKGALEYDREAEKLKCHECGRWKSGLGGHVRVHGITSREYKLRHSLRLVTGLLSPTFSVRAAENGRERAKNPRFTGGAKRRTPGGWPRPTSGLTSATP